MESVQKSELSNGVRILTEHLPYVGSASIGVWCTTGSTHETESEAGITHFIEHMLFKGTPKRTSHQIAESIEGRGECSTHLPTKNAHVTTAEFLLKILESDLMSSPTWSQTPFLTPTNWKKKKGLFSKKSSGAKMNPEITFTTSIFKDSGPRLNLVSL
ncbi:hypothetical protein CCB80_06700 [Armatimonadetes bacterium Uphvl-Ar1]|nr:hypothetical protein CCB80_06700 [Armatimonadetes bacterium Uphvl-Ar1]